MDTAEPPVLLTERLIGVQRRETVWGVIPARTTGGVAQLEDFTATLWWGDTNGRRRMVGTQFFMGAGVARRGDEVSLPVPSCAGDECNMDQSVFSKSLGPSSLLCRFTVRIRSDVVENIDRIRASQPGCGVLHTWT